MLTTLLQIVSDSSPSNHELIQKPATDYIEPAIILFIGKTWVEANSIKQRMAPSMPDFSYLEEIEYQSSRSFFESHFSKIRENDLKFVGFDTFQSWCNDIELLFTVPPTNKAKKTSTKPSVTQAVQLKAVCKPPLNTTDDTNTLLCQQIYSEFLLLALSGTYKTGKIIRVAPENSHFAIQQNIDVMQKIELLLEKYRTWMLSEKLIDPGVSNLSALGFTKSTSLNGLNRTHLVCYANANFPPNVLHYFRKIADNVEVVENQPQKTLRLLQTDAKLIELHQHIQFCDALGEKFAKIAIPLVMKQNDNYIKTFTIKTVGANKHAPFIALLKHANLKDAAENVFAEYLLEKLGDYVLDSSFPLPPTAMDYNSNTETAENFIAFANMYGEILDFLVEKQLETRPMKDYDPISNIICSFAFLFISKSLEMNHANYALYRKALRIFENSEIKNIFDLRNIQSAFIQIHNTVLMKSNVPSNTTDPKIEKIWAIMSDMYSAVIKTCGQIKICLPFSYVAIQAHQLEKEHARHYNRSNQKSLTHKIISFCNVLACFTNELSYAEEEKIRFKPEFFKEVFNFFSQNPIEPFWHTPTNKEVFFHLFDFFLNMVIYSLSIPQKNYLAPFSWEKLTSLFDNQSFALSEKEKTIVNAIKDLGVYATSSPYNPCTVINKKLAYMNSLRQELETPNPVYTNNASPTFYGPTPNIRYNGDLPTPH